jgi:hypothetical protein
VRESQSSRVKEEQDMGDLVRIELRPYGRSIDIERGPSASPDGGAAPLEPVDLVARLAALVPPPRANIVRYHGALAPCASCILAALHGESEK